MLPTKKISVFTDKKNCLAAAAALWVPVVLLFLLFLSPSFETNDDMAIMSIVNGARGVNDPHVIQHYFLGLLYRALYLADSHFPWYTAIQYLMLTLAFISISFVLLQRSQGWAGLGMSGILTAFYATQCFGNIQYTKTAGTLTCAGILLMFHSLSRTDADTDSAERHTAPSGEHTNPPGRHMDLPGRHKEPAGKKAGFSGRYAGLAAGLILALFGSMYRFDAFLSTAAVMTGIGIWELFSVRRSSAAAAEGAERRGGEKTLQRVLLRYLPAFFVLLILSAALRAGDMAVYRSDERWESYRDYNEARSSLQDYGFPSYDEHQEAYEALGLGPEAYLMYSRWDQYDPDMLDADVMRSLAALRPKRTLSPGLLKGFLKEIPALFMETRMFYCFLMMLAVMIFMAVSAGKWKDPGIWLPLLWEAAVFLLLFFYLYYRGRFSMERISVGYWMAATLFAAWAASELSRQAEMTIGISQAAALCVIAFGFYHSYWVDLVPGAGEETSVRRQEKRQILEEFGEDKDHLYIRKTMLLTMDECYAPFDTIPEGVISNQATFGGWLCSTPVQLDINSRYGVSNPYRDCVDNERVYIVDNHIDWTLAYIRKYYAPDAQAAEVEDRKAFKVYKITSKD